MYHHLYVTRREHRLKQKDMAAKLNIHPISHQRKEIGKTPFTLDEAFKVADLFGTTVDELFRDSKK